MPRTSIGLSFVVLALAGFFFAQAVTAIPRLSITFDEDMHITSGYSILRTGDFRLMEEHPALVKIWMAWPLLFHPQLPSPYQLPGWEEGDLNRAARNSAWWQIPIDSWTVPCRVMIALIGPILCVSFFRWAREWFGAASALGALLFLVFDPNLLAHATLATIDLGATCFMFISVYALQRCHSRFTWSRFWTAGFTLGVALAAKISALLLVPVCMAFILLSPSFRLKGMLLPLYVGTAFITLWALHFFEIGNLNGTMVPLHSYWRALMRVAQHTTTGDTTYALGEVYKGGKWYFFPLVFLLKTPLPALFFFGSGFLIALRHRGWRYFALLAFLCGYFGVSLLSAINLGYRHLLPVLPFLYLLVPLVIRSLTSKGKKRIIQWGVLLLMGWQAIGTLKIWPFYLTYFNEIVGGPQNGYKYLADSNVDWGQGLKALRAYLEKRNDPLIRLSSFTFFISPKLYGVQVTPLPPLLDAPAVLPARFHPAPGVYVISASTLRGLQCADPAMYNWFWHYEPNEIVANSMLVYEVEKANEAITLAQCEVPTKPLSLEAAIEGFGEIDIRISSFNCVQSWFYPADPHPVVYAFHHSLLEENRCGFLRLFQCSPKAQDPFIRRHLSSTHLVYEQRNNGLLPAFALYQNEGFPSLPTIPAYPLSAETPVPEIQASIPNEKPIPLDGPLTFLGALVLVERSSLNVETWWQVTEGPITRPLSIMGHLLNGAGEVIGQNDGLGVSPVVWQPGDIIVQRHQFPLPPADEELWLRTGAYWLDTTERWRVPERPDADAIFVRLEP